MTSPSAAADQVSILIPSNLDERGEWLAHRLRYLAAAGHRGEIIVGIWGGHARIAPLRRAVAAIDGPAILLVEQEGTKRFTQRVRELADLASGDFIVMQGDDDYLVPAAIEKSVALLRQDPTVGCAQGRIINHTLGDETKSEIAVTSFPLWNAREADAVARFCNMMKHHTFLWHATFRRHHFVERARLMDEVAAASHDDVFWEVTGDMFGVIKGKVVIFDELYMVRGEHPKNATGRANRTLNFRFGGLLPLSPHFTPSYKFFESRILALFAEAGVDVSDAATLHRILLGMMSFLNHACFKVRSAVEPEEQAFLKGLQGEGAPVLAHVFKQIRATQTPLIFV